MGRERLLEHLAAEDPAAHLLLEHGLDEPLAGRRGVVQLQQQQKVQRVVHLRRTDAVQRLSEGDGTGRSAGRTFVKTAAAAGVKHRQTEQP